MSISDNPLPEHDLLIVGGGFGACSALAWLARFCPGPARIAVLTGTRKAECSAREPGCGLAYGDQDPTHLLNAAHWNMGILDDDPDGFTRWLASSNPGAVQPDFASRADYGAFLRGQWTKSLGVLTAKGVIVTLIEQDAVTISSVTDQWVTVLDDAGAIRSAAAVLVCSGPTLAAQVSLAHPKLITPIWPLGLQRLAGASGHVVVIGTGLSGIDATVSALAQVGVSKVTMISGDGRLPLPHDTSSRQNLELCFKGHPLEVLRSVRSAAVNVPWQTVMNALRGQSNRLWQNWTPDQCRAALRHLGGIWAAHRNRLPVDVSAQIASAKAAKRLDVIKGFVTLLTSVEGDLCVQIENNGLSVRPDWVVDARGFARVTAASKTFLGHALRDGYFSTSSLGYGVAADSNHRATPEGLAPVHVVGAARLGDLIETTGAPEVRAQVRQSLEALFP